MSAAAVAIIAYAFLCLGGIIGWLARNAIVREQADPEPSEFATNWVERRRP